MRYWGIEEATKEVLRRQVLNNLRHRIEEVYNLSWLPAGGPFGFLGRHIASCRLEELQFYKRCVRSGLQPLWLEYLEDKWCRSNPSKIRLVKLRIVLGRGKRGGIKEEVRKIINDFQFFSNKIMMKDLSTPWGEALWEFHHRALKGIIKGILGPVEIPVEILDISCWLKGWGRASNYYEPYLALALAHGILFESFESPGFPDLQRFKLTVVLPAYQRLVERWGVEPLIVYHPVPRELEGFYLNYYPPQVLKFIP